MTVILKSCPFCGNKKEVDVRALMEAKWVKCYRCDAVGPAGRKYDEAVELWNQRREWVPFREALEMSDFRYGVLYPAKFPTASEPHRYGHVRARKHADGRMFYYVNGHHQPSLDTRAENLWGEPIVGDVLVLVSALEEYADQEGGGTL